MKVAPTLLKAVQQQLETSTGANTAPAPVMLVKGTVSTATLCFVC